MVIMGIDKKAETASVSEYRDLTLDDFRVISDCFLEESYIFECGEENEDFCPYMIFSQPKWLKAVKISNDGEVRKLGRDRFRGVLLNKDHGYIDKYDDKSTISMRMGIHLCFRRCPFIVEYSPYDDFPPNVNPAAFYMLLGTNTSDYFESWGRLKFPKYDNATDPTFLVFRQDRKDITTHQVEALSNYCQNVMFDALLDEDGTWDKREKEEVLDRYCSAQEFTKFFETFKKQKIEDDDESWADATVPVGMRKHKLKENSDRISKRRERHRHHRQKVRRTWSEEMKWRIATPERHLI